MGFRVDPVRYWTDKTRGSYRRDGNKTIREYQAIDAFEVSIVREPTWTQTEVAVRGAPLPYSIHR